jgi:dihydrofolate synthase / folylpolyglutamate synthase
VPVVTTAENAEVVGVIERVATEVGARLSRVGRDFDWHRDGDLPFETPPVRVRAGARDLGLFPLRLYGHHQGGNAAAVVESVEQLCRAGLKISGEAMTAGMYDVIWPARMELISRRPVVVLDCAHNVASVRALVQTLSGSFPVNGRRHLVLAMSSDKQIPEMLAELAPVIDQFHLTRFRSNPRSADPETVADTLRKLARNEIFSHPTPESAWAAARETASLDDGIVVAGSVFLAGELRPLMVRDCQS